MFGIGWAELLVIGLVALVVVGPDKLPEMARAIGKFYGQIQRFLNETKSGLATEMDLAEFKKDLSEPEYPKKDVSGPE